VTLPRIVFDRVWKKFQRGEIHDSLRDLIPAVARRLIGRGALASELQEGDFWAVKDLSFEVVPGQTLGIIGPNGSGKSTSLKLLTRILEPSRGYAHVDGRLGALIEISAGFHGDLTGRENVFLQGAIMGMRRADIERKFDDIVGFSGVEDFIDTPVKRYSSGMNARLGFSIAAYLEPDVLIIDEVLAVGDMAFQEKAFGRIRDLARSGIPVIMVSHQLERIAELCTDVILLEKGEGVVRGTANDVIAAYVSRHDAARVVAKTGLIQFESLRPLDTESVRSGERFAVQVNGNVAGPLGERVEPLLLRVRSLRSGKVVYSTGSRRLGLEQLQPGPFSVRLELQANLTVGSYMIELAAMDMTSMQDLDTAPSVMLRVSDSSNFSGNVQLNAAMSLS
jgi:lipopolysaccharide transport system ATP-binding protein